MPLFGKSNKENVPHVILEDSFDAYGTNDDQFTYLLLRNQLQKLETQQTQLQQERSKDREFYSQLLQQALHKNSQLIRANGALLKVVVEQDAALQEYKNRLATTVLLVGIVAGVLLLV